jgi:hypothetical protein
MASSETAIPRMALRNVFMGDSKGDSGVAEAKIFDVFNAQALPAVYAARAAGWYVARALRTPVFALGTARRAHGHGCKLSKPKWVRQRTDVF